MKKVTSFLAVLTVVLIAVSCEKDKHIPPDVSFKTGATYISADATLTTDTTVTVGFVAQKTEDELKSFNVSHMYDNATSTTTDTTIALSGAEEEHFEKEYSITTRDVAGTEKWIFTIIDRDGNISQKELVLTVQ